MGKDDDSLTEEGRGPRFVATYYLPVAPRGASSAPAGHRSPPRPVFRFSQCPPAPPAVPGSGRKVTRETVEVQLSLWVDFVHPLHSDTDPNLGPLPQPPVPSSPSLGLLSSVPCRLVRPLRSGRPVTRLIPVSGSEWRGRVPDGVPLLGQTHETYILDTYLLPLLSSYYQNPRNPKQ